MNGPRRTACLAKGMPNSLANFLYFAMRKYPSSQTFHQWASVASVHMHDNYEQWTSTSIREHSCLTGYRIWIPSLQAFLILDRFCWTKMWTDAYVHWLRIHSGWLRIHSGLVRPWTDNIGSGLVQAPYHACRVVEQTNKKISFIILSSL